MLVRQRLASNIFIVVPFRNPERRNIFKDMIILYEKETEIAVRPDLESENCYCLETSDIRKLDRCVTFPT